MFVVYPESVVTCTLYVIAPDDPPVGAAQFNVKLLEVIPAATTVLGIAGHVIAFPVKGPEVL